MVDTGIFKDESSFEPLVQHDFNWQGQLQMSNHFSVHPFVFFMHVFMHVLGVLPRKFVKKDVTIEENTLGIAPFQDHNGHSLFLFFFEGGPY